MTMVSLKVNTGYRTYPTELRDRWVATKTINKPGCIPRQTGHHQWRVGDQGSVHLDAPLLWTLMEVRIIEPLSPELYRCTITRFDGSLTQLAGLSIGDELMVENQQFFAHWGPNQTRDEGEGPHKVYEEGSTQRPKPTQSGEQLH